MTTIDDLARVERELREQAQSAIAYNETVLLPAHYVLEAADTIAAFVREQRERDAGGLSEVLDAYEVQTRALPSQHEIPHRGCCSYNWRMAIIRDLRAMLNQPPTATSAKESSDG